VPAGTGKDGVGTAASFSDPFSISVSTDGSFALFAEVNTMTIKKIDLATATVTTIAKETQSLGGVTLSRDGSFALIATGAAGRIRKLVVATGKVTTLAGNSVVDQWPATNGIGAAASFNRPKGLALSADGSWAVVSESGGHRIRKVVVSTGLVTTLAGNPPGCKGHTTCRGHANGVGSAATFDNPNRIALSSDDSFALVTDGTNGGLIRKIVIAILKTH
jgi:DNA-binding beta-propeller fold protein YncE